MQSFPRPQFLSLSDSVQSQHTTRVISQRIIKLLPSWFLANRVSQSFSHNEISILANFLHLAGRIVRACASERHPWKSSVRFSTFATISSNPSRNESPWHRELFQEIGFISSKSCRNLWGLSRRTPGSCVFSAQRVRLSLVTQWFQYVK